MYTIDDLDIIILANKRKESLTDKFLDREKIPYQIYYNPDWEWGDTEIDPRLQCLGAYSIGPYRCYRGHQEMLKLAKKRFVLALEDDAIPNDPKWLEVVLEHLVELKYYKFISMHGRDWQKFGATQLSNQPKYNMYVTHDGWLNPTIKGKWVLGSLAYIVEAGSDGFTEFVNTPYRGIPMDLWLANHHSFALVDPSPFDHVRDKGSLIDTAEFNYKPKL